MKTYVYIAESLDGYIARKNGDLDWLNEIPNPEGSDFGFYDFLEQIDAIVMGKNTFEKVLTFPQWPYLKPVFVLSRSLKALPDHLSKKAFIASGNPASVLKNLRKLGFNSLYIDGGKTIQGFLIEDLIDELIISRVPVLLGDGIPLFNKLAKELHFEHYKTDVFSNCLVKSHYKRKRE